jgi:polyferredoxin
MLRSGRGQKSSWHTTLREFYKELIKKKKKKSKKKKKRSTNKTRKRPFLVHLSLFVFLVDFQLKKKIKNFLEVHSFQVWFKLAQWFWR